MLNLAEAAPCSAVQGLLAGGPTAVQRAASRQSKASAGSPEQRRRAEAWGWLIVAALGGLGRQSDRLGARHDLTPPAAVITGSVPWKSKAVLSPGSVNLVNSGPTNAKAACVWHLMQLLPSELKPCFALNWR